jgi:hypothetical protein
MSAAHAEHAAIKAGFIQAIVFATSIARVDAVIEAAVFPRQAAWMEEARAGGALS